MKKIVFFVVAFVLAVAPYAFALGGVEWLSLKEGMQRAGNEKKPMIVDFFFGKGCPRCEMLQKAVYDNPQIAKKIMDDFIPIRVDLTRDLTKEEEKLGEQYDYKKDCLLLFLDHAGKIVKEPGGKRLCFIDNVEPDLFVKYLDTVKAAITGKEKP